jgi:DNA polymerase-1
MARARTTPPHVLREQTDQDDDAALAAWLARRLVGIGPQVLHDLKPQLLVLQERGWRWRASPATPRWPPTSRCRVRASSTWPTSRCAILRRELRARCADDGQLSCDGRGGGRRRRRPRGARPRGAPTCRSRWTPTSSGAGGTALLRDLELPLWRCWPTVERTGIAADVDHLASCETRLRDQVKAAARGRVRHGRARVPPRLAQAAAGAAVRRARPAEDQEDQDRRYNHRRRRLGCGV